MPELINGTYVSAIVLALLIRLGRIARPKAKKVSADFELSQIATNQSMAASKIAAISNRLAYTNASWICARFAAFA
jgi:hypothetical protein